MYRILIFKCKRKNFEEFITFKKNIFYKVRIAKQRTKSLEKRIKKYFLDDILLFQTYIPVNLLHNKNMF